MSFIYKKCAFGVGPAFLLIVMLTVIYSANATDSVYIDAAKSGQVSVKYDTIFVGGHYELRFWLENDYVLGGLTLGFQVWSPDGVTWAYLSQPEGIGMHNYATIVPGSRMDGDPPPFDMFGLLLTEQNIDCVGHDTLMFGGLAQEIGLQPGPSEHMMSFHFMPTGPYTSEPGVVGSICFDTSFMPPSVCQFCFIDMWGNANMPLWGGPLTIPVKLLCGNPNGDDDVNVGDCVFMINHIFRDGPAPVPWQLGDANCDGVLDVGDVVFLIAASFRYGPQPECCE